MADISTHIENIQKASRGEAVRDAIIDALNAVNQLGTNANTLDGHPAEDFVTAANLQSSMETIGSTIDTINGVVINGGVSSKLAETSAAKKEIESAITDKGVSIPSNATFRSYADSIREISGSSDLESIDITENGDYYAENLGVNGWKELHVDTTQSLIDLNVTQNGTYTAESEGVTGFKSVTVNVAASYGTTGPFTVRFFDETGTTIIRTVTNVRGGGHADYTGPTPTSSTPGLVFTGWDPSPYNIQGDTYCYPVFTDPGSQVAGEISDSWATIIANGGANYAIGSYKTIGLVETSSILDPRKYNGNISISGCMCSVKKVANGEAGTGSSWLIYGCPDLRYNNAQIQPSMFKPYVNEGNWTDSDFRKWLNGEFLSKMIPAELRNGIKSVLKYTWCWDSDVNGYRQMSSVDKLWLPSFREVHMNNQSGDNNIINSGYSETAGVEYYKNSENVNTRLLRLAGNNGLPTGGYVFYGLRSGGSSNLDSNYMRYYKGVTNSGIIEPNQGERIDRGQGTYSSCITNVCFGFCI